MRWRFLEFEELPGALRILGLGIGNIVFLGQRWVHMSGIVFYLVVVFLSILDVFSMVLVGLCTFFGTCLLTNCLYLFFLPLPPFERWTSWNF